AAEVPAAGAEEAGIANGVGSEFDLRPIERASRVGILVEIECDEDPQAVAVAGAIDTAREGHVEFEIALVEPLALEDFHPSDVEPLAGIPDRISEGLRDVCTSRADEEEGSRCAGEQYP